MPCTSCCVLKTDSWAAYWTEVCKALQGPLRQLCFVTDRIRQTPQGCTQITSACCPWRGSTMVPECCPTFNGLMLYSWLHVMVHKHRAPVGDRTQLLQWLENGRVALCTHLHATSLVLWLIFSYVVYYFILFWGPVLSVCLASNSRWKSSMVSFDLQLHNIAQPKQQAQYVHQRLLWHLAKRSPALSA